MRKPTSTAAGGPGETAPSPAGPLEVGLRKELEKRTLEARRVAEAGAQAALAALAVSEAAPFRHMDAEGRALRNRLRAHGRAVGDRRDASSGRQTIERLRHECAYEQWHRMLFARFLAENDLLVEPASGVAVSLEECRDLARDEGRDMWDLVGRYAARMLPEIFRPDDPVLAVRFAPEDARKLEGLLDGLPKAIFRAGDALGWVYQFWRKEEKDAVNRSGDKIDGDRLPAVTQLFTEHYMVEFLLHNSLGAWWVARHGAEERERLRLTFLRVKDDGSPAAGGFAQWPRTARELRILDPCCGSGHFLVTLLPLLVAMRETEERIGREEAVRRVLAENLFGLEIDARCTQIAAFNLALAAWKLVGRHVELPDLNVACSGLSIAASKKEWADLAPPGAGFLFERLYDLFKRARHLGSLINPGQERLEDLLGDQMDRVMPLVEELLAREDRTSDGQFETGVTAKGIAQAASILGGRYHLVATNVPYRGRLDLDTTIKYYIEEHYRIAKPNLASAFLMRSIEFCAEGGTAAFVALYEWLFLGSYTHLRRVLLERCRWHWVTPLGPRAFETISGERVNVALTAVSHVRPTVDHVFFGVDVSEAIDPPSKATGLARESLTWVDQQGQSENPDARITLAPPSTLPLLSEYVVHAHGISAADLPRFGRQFWELHVDRSNRYHFWQSSTKKTDFYQGRSLVFVWDNEFERLVDRGIALVRGQKTWGRRGVVVTQMSSLPCSLFTGEKIDTNCVAVVPHDESLVAPIWCFMSSPEFAGAIRAIDKKLNVTAGTFVKVPFDVDHWRQIAAPVYPNGLPEPYSPDPTQWLFKGRVDDTTQPLHVAVARLVGYRWPAELDAEKAGVRIGDEDRAHWEKLARHADADGIVCRAPLRAKRGAADRLRALLADALGADWSPARERELLAATGSKAKSLEEWLRDDFFAEHCKVFHHRPFIWHVWDGRKDGFHALVNYHRLAAPGGAGRKLLETLAYSYLGDWITRQREAVAEGEAGAEARLAAAQELQRELARIIEGEPPYDIFVRWKPLQEQPIGWEPDLDDGVRLNIRPFMSAKLSKGRKGAGVLRSKPNIKWGKDRGREPERPKADFPWFWGWDGSAVDWPGGPEFTAERWNGCHYRRAAREAARRRTMEGNRDV